MLREFSTALLLLRDVTGEGLLRSAVAWFCVEMESAVGLLALRCYGCYEVLNSHSSFSQPDVKAGVRRDRSFRVVHERAR